MFNLRKNALAFKELLYILTQYSELTFALAKREITDRYTAQVFGLFWAFGHPLIIMLVYLFVFSFVFKVRVGDNPTENYSVYLLAGIIPWISYMEVLGKSSSVIVQNSSLVKQVVFPIEILPVKGILASMFTQVIFTFFLIFYALLATGRFAPTFLLVPLLMLIQAFGMIGVGFILAAIGTYFRDIKDFVQAYTTIGLYIMPVLYFPSQVPEAVRFLLYINPLSYMIWCYQDAFFYGYFAHPIAWPVFTLLSLFLFIFGFRIFRKLSVMFGNVL